MPPLLLLLLIALSWDRTSGQEGCEDKPCPAAPLVKKIPPSTAQYDYSANILADSTSGDTIYKCKYGVLNLYSSPAEPLTETSILICKKDTGYFVRRYADGREVAVSATDEFVCRGPPCPALPALEPATVTVPEPFVVAKCGVTTVKNQDATVVVCPEGTVLYDVSDQNDPQLVQPEQYPKCISASGSWSTSQQTYKCLKTPFTGLGDDSCIKSQHPDILKLNGTRFSWPICRNDWPTIYVIRAIDEFGNRVTLDNDEFRQLQFDPTKGDQCGGGLWAYTDTATYNGVIIRPTIYLKALTCAVADSKPCGCGPLPQRPTPNGKPGVPVWLDGDYVCRDPKMIVSYYWYRAQPPHHTGIPGVPKSYKFTCMAGIWMLINKEGDIKYSGWKVDEAVCYPP